MKTVSTTKGVALTPKSGDVTLSLSPEVMRLPLLETVGASPLR